MTNNINVELELEHQSLWVAIWREMERKQQETQKQGK